MYTGFRNPVSVWTKEGLSEEQYNEVENMLTEFINENSGFTFKK